MPVILMLCGLILTLASVGSLLIPRGQIPERVLPKRALSSTAAVRRESSASLNLPIPGGLRAAWEQVGRRQAGWGGKENSAELHEVSELLRTLAALSSSGLPFSHALHRAASVLEPSDPAPGSKAALNAESSAAGALCALLSLAAEAEHLGLDPVPVLQRSLATHTDLLVRRFGQETAACWHLARTSGMPLGVLLETLADSAAERADAEDAASAALAAPAATARLLMWLPVIGAALGCVLLGSAWFRALFSPGGMACALVGSAFMAAGSVWARRIVQRAHDVEAV